MEEYWRNVETKRRNTEERLKPNKHGRNIENKWRNIEKNTETKWKKLKINEGKTMVKEEALKKHWN